MDGDDGVDEAGEQAAGEYGVFFNELGKVVETGGYRKSKEGKSHDNTQVADQG